LRPNLVKVVVCVCSFSGDCFCTVWDYSLCLEIQGILILVVVAVTTIVTPADFSSSSSHPFSSPPSPLHLSKFFLPKDFFTKVSVISQLNLQLFQEIFGFLFQNPRASSSCVKILSLLFNSKFPSFYHV